MKKYFIGTIVLSTYLTTPSFAGYYIDMQGVSRGASQESRSIDGYNMLSGKYYGIVHEIGQGVPIPTQSFGESATMADAMFFILPEGWYAYVDERIEELPRVTWNADVPGGVEWLQVLADVGKDYGLRYTVDWDQNLVQVDLAPNFVKPDFNDPVVVSDSNNERQLFIYKQQPSLSGYLLKDGEYIPVRVQ